MVTPSPLRADFAGRHGLQRHRQIMQSPASRKSYRVRGVQHRRFVAQRIAGRAAGDLGEVLLGSEPGPAPEQAVEVKFRQADMPVRFPRASAGARTRAR